MTWPLWLVAIIAGIAVLLVGWWMRAAFHHERTTPSRRAQSILAAVLVLVAISASIDTVYLQVDLNKRVKGQVECNRRMVESEQSISEQRKAVDQAAAMYDIAQHEWLIAGTGRAIIPADDPAYLNLQSALHDVTVARLKMLQVYADHPFLHCGKS